MPPASAEHLSSPRTGAGERQWRRANAGDLDALLELEQQSFAGDRLSRRQYRRHLASDSACVLVVASDARRLLGSAVMFFRKGATIARLYSLATAPEVRGRGVGRALLDAIIDEAREHGASALRLEVRQDNVAAIRLYELAGFVRIGSYHGYYDDGADAWRYQRLIDHA